MRTALVAGSVAAVVVTWLAVSGVAQAAEPELAVLLRGMAAIKGLLAFSAGGLVWWRLGQPVSLRVAASYLACVWVLFASTALIWQLAFILAAAVLFPRRSSCRASPCLARGPSNTPLRAASAQPFHRADILKPASRALGCRSCQTLGDTRAVNPTYFGDSYDLVKRFFCEQLSSLGYTVSIEAMLTGEWAGAEVDFFKLICAAPLAAETSPKESTAVFVDPDTGVHSKASLRHVSLSRLVELSSQYPLVFAFDQSFSRQAKFPGSLLAKLAQLEQLGVHGMYYNSHARFLFVAKDARALERLRSHLVGLGLPASRLPTSVT